MVHFALDDSEVRMCTELKGKARWLLPFNKGWNDGAGNPPNPNGLKTDYLWKEVLTPASLTNILKNYAQIIEVKHPKTGKKKLTRIFPRFHQLGVVREVLFADGGVTGAWVRQAVGGMTARGGGPPLRRDRGLARDYGNRDSHSNRDVPAKAGGEGVEAGE